ncbi:hypothetical protein FEZ41_03530 [Lentilactobacillus parafarraginis]|uniref:YozE SAM-like domain-containing protein n=1 Tax=Lentilactobacillus parafarraginis TaxID=390842 RepID=A0A5R9CZ92_9LACO|nr:YozE family protein [Lentilactobacillus parafarraginis]TLQ20461.1 hypothetical protein FEZ41_03530 [Lentilactobacillus parafarraginis]
MSFYDWLQEFADVNLPIGDFAKDVREDKTFPKNVDNWQDLEQHILSVNLGAEVDKIHNAFNYYLAEEYH